MSGHQPVPSGRVGRPHVLDHVGGAVALLLSGVAMATWSWSRLAARSQVTASAAGLALAVSASAYLYRVQWPMDLSGSERLERARTRAMSHQPLQPWAILVLTAIGMVGAVLRVDAILVVGGLGMAGFSLYLLLYVAVLRRRRGPDVWAELAAAQELSSSLLAAKSGRAYRGRILP